MSYHCPWDGMHNKEKEKNAKDRINVQYKISQAKPGCA